MECPKPRLKTSQGKTEPRGYAGHRTKHTPPRPCLPVVEKDCGHLSEGPGRGMGPGKQRHSHGSAPPAYETPSHAVARSSLSALPHCIERKSKHSKISNFSKDKRQIHVVSPRSMVLCLQHMLQEQAGPSLKSSLATHQLEPWGSHSLRLHLLIKVRMIPSHSQGCCGNEMKYSCKELSAPE